MVTVRLSIRKSLEENAATYFDEAKKARRKTEGVRKTLDRFSQQVKSKARETPLQRTGKREWYESYRWSKTSTDRLLVGGRDAATNEVLVKKYADAQDVVFHSEMPGSPFVILKGSPDEASLTEAAVFCACYSKAWKEGLGVADVFWVRPDQLSKTPNTGEYISKGSFIVRGEKHFERPALQLALGIVEGKAMAASEPYFVKHRATYALLVPGPDATSDVAKRLAKKLGGVPDDWNKLIPAGGGRIQRFAGAEQNGTNKNAGHPEAA